VVTSPAKPRGLVALEAVVLVACNGDAPCNLRACDILQPDCQQMAEAAAACWLGKPPVHIPVTVVSRSQYVASENAAAGSGDVTAAQRRLNALELLDLADPHVTPQEAATSLADRVQAFYEPSKKRIVIVGEDDPSAALDGAFNTILLVHESTHALQDTVGRLDSPPPDGDRSYDRAIAQAALIEGEASLTETLSTLALFGHDVPSVPWPQVFARLHDLGTRVGAAAPVPIDLAYSYFAYPFGLSTMYEGYAAGGAAGVDAIWAAPPTSTRHILRRSTDPGATTDLDSVDLGADSVPALPAAYEYIDGDRVGAFVFELFLVRIAAHSDLPVADASQIRRLAEGLAGDYLSLFRKPTEDTPAACWRLRFASPEARDAATSFLQARPRNWKLETQDRDLIITAPGPGDLVQGAGWKAPPAPPAFAAFAASAARGQLCAHRAAGFFSRENAR
jgi:hypothetical protein